MRPDTGVHCKCPENTMINNNAHQKIGMEYPTSADDINNRSHSLPRLTAAITPAGRPKRTAKTMQHSANSKVAGNSAKNSSQTGRLVTKDCPKSPCNMPVK